MAGYICGEIRKRIELAEEGTVFAQKETSVLTIDVERKQLAELKGGGRGN